SVQLIGALLTEVAVEPQVLFGLRKRVEQHACQHHGTHGMQLVLEGGNHAEVAATTPEAPEEVRVLAGADVAELAVGGDEIGGNEVVAGQTVPARQPANTAPQGEAGNAGVGIGTAGGSQAESLGFMVEFTPLDAALSAHGTPAGVNPDALHPAQVNHQS